MILLVDNHDSFVFNLYQGLAALGAEVHVHRNDALSVDEALALAPDAVVLSPGPGRPEEAGLCLELLERLPDATPVLGVCLGHQALVLQAGGRLEVDEAPVHGKTSLVHHSGGTLLRGLPTPLPCGRYHSLRAERGALPEALQLVGWTEEGHVMAVQDRARPRYGLQFHPESILTPRGERVLANFLAAAGEPVAPRPVASSAIGARP